MLICNLKHACIFATMQLVVAFLFWNSCCWLCFMLFFFHHVNNAIYRLYGPSTHLNEYFRWFTLSVFFYVVFFFFLVFPLMEKRVRFSLRYNFIFLLLFLQQIFFFVLQKARTLLAIHIIMNCLFTVIKFK